MGDDPETDEGGGADGPAAELRDAPPEDAQDWTDDEWIAWLEATDGPAAGAADSRPPEPSWRRRSAPAQLLAAGMIGVANALYGRKDDEVAIVAEAPGAPPMDDEPVEVHIDPDDPAASTAIVRSWLVDDDDDEPPGAPTDGRPGTGRPGPAGPVTNR